MNTYYKILNEIASVFDMDQWDEQVNSFVGSIKKEMKFFKYKNPFWDMPGLGKIYIFHGTPSNIYTNKLKIIINGKSVSALPDKKNNKWYINNLNLPFSEDIDIFIEGCENIEVGDTLFSSTDIKYCPDVFSKIQSGYEMFAYCQSLIHVEFFSNLKEWTYMDIYNNFPWMFRGTQWIDEETKTVWKAAWDHS